MTAFLRRKGSSLPSTFFLGGERLNFGGDYFLGGEGLDFPTTPTDLKRRESTKCMGFLKRNLILQGAILRFHVKLWEGTVKSFFGGEQKLCFYSPKIISLLAEDCYFWSFNFLLQIPDSLK